MLPQMVTLIAAGAIVSKWGHYVFENNPYLVVWPAELTMNDRYHL